MDAVVSRDGTTIAFDRLGDGPPVILVCGGSVDRMSNAQLAQALAADFTVFNYDRRGRGDSGDTQPYAVAREVEDIEAVIQTPGGEASLWGSSSGGVLALVAAASGLPITKLALCEPPYVSEGFPRPPQDQVAQYKRMVAEGRRGTPWSTSCPKPLACLPSSWPRPGANRSGLARRPWPTLAYDARIMSDYRVPTKLGGSVKVPTLVIAGGADMPWMPETARALADSLPAGQTRFLDGQGHAVDPEVLAPVLKDFFR
jgi:pimeloyl-ACP methyl ester carboxylesterase